MCLTVWIAVFANVSVNIEKIHYFWQDLELWLLTTTIMSQRHRKIQCFISPSESRTQSPQFIYWNCNYWSFSPPPHKYRILTSPTSAAAGMMGSLFVPFFTPTYRHISLTTSSIARTRSVCAHACDTIRVNSGQLECLNVAQFTWIHSKCCVL